MRGSPCARPAIAAQNVGWLADNTNRLVNEQGRPAAEDMRKAIASVQQAADNLNAMVTDARPGVQNFSKSTLPEANQLVRDLRDLRDVAARASPTGSNQQRHRRHARARRSCPTTSQGKRK